MRFFLFFASAITAAGLIVNAIIHLTLAGPYEGNPGTLVSQGVLFRIQAVAGLVAGTLILFRPRPATALLTVVIALAGLASLLVTLVTPLDLTPLGGPFIFEPAWYKDKIIAASAQILAIAGGITVMLITRRAPAGTHRGR
jgi:membrane-associated PAP2 superfamily phosphatase